MKIILISILLIGITGCYTVVWMPSDEMPKSYQKNEFYNSDYFGGYYDYYDTPWWILNPINIYSPSQSIHNQTYNRDEKLNNVRNQSGDRNESVRGREGVRENSNRNEYTPPAPVTISSGSNQGNSNNSSNQNNAGSSTNISNEEPDRIRSNNNDSNSIRNESGNRNSENSRR